jgi:DNA-directed RNA polymerase subunit RPC12/RpoP
MPDLPERMSNGQYPAFTSVGCYTLFYLTKAGEILCAACASKDEENQEDPVVACDVYWEGPPMSCAGCNSEIESSYGDPNEQD